MLNSRGEDSIQSHIEWIGYKGEKILYVNYSGLLDDGLTDATDEVNSYIKSLEKKENLILVDVRNSNAYEEMTVDALKKNASIVKPYAKKVAIIGVTKTQEVILTMVNMFSGLGIKPFKNIDDAKNWLIE